MAPGALVREMRKWSIGQRMSKQISDREGNRVVVGARGSLPDPSRAVPKIRCQSFPKRFFIFSLVNSCGTADTNVHGTDVELLRPPLDQRLGYCNISQYWDIDWDKVIWALTCMFMRIM